MPQRTSTPELDLVLQKRTSGTGTGMPMFLRYCQDLGAMVRKLLLTSVSAAVLSSSAVMAADMAVKARPMPAPVPTWTGFYAGLNAGYAWGTSDTTLVGSAALPPLEIGFATGNPPSLSPRGFIGGGQAGYNRQMGQWVFGGEIDFSGLDAKANASLSPFFTGKGQQKTFTWSTRNEWLFTARLRGGVLVAPNWLLYVTGGLAVTQVNDSVACTSLPGSACGNSLGGSSVTWSDSRTLTGGTIGGGVETMFAPGWTARAEYLYARFSDTTPPVTSTTGGPFFPVTTPIPSLFSFSHDLNVFRVAVNYKFGP
jgi:outer membrane immunogenic protein